MATSRANKRDSTHYRVSVALGLEQLLRAAARVTRFMAQFENEASTIDAYICLLRESARLALIKDAASQSKLAKLIAAGVTTDCITIIERGKGAPEDVAGICIVCGMRADRAVLVFCKLRPDFENSEWFGKMLYAIEDTCRKVGCQQLELILGLRARLRRVVTDMGYVVPLQQRTHMFGLTKAFIDYILRVKHLDMRKLPADMQNKPRNVWDCFAATLALHVDNFDAKAYEETFPSIVSAQTRVCLSKTLKQ